MKFIKGGASIEEQNNEHTITLGDDEQSMQSNKNIARNTPISRHNNSTMGY